MQLKLFCITDIHSPDSFSMAELKAEDFDLVFTLGDINEDTIDYIKFMTRFVYSYGVLGNHDPKVMPGLDNIHGKVVEYKGIKIGGFGGH